MEVLNSLSLSKQNELQFFLGGEKVLMFVASGMFPAEVEKVMGAAVNPEKASVS